LGHPQSPDARGQARAGPKEAIAVQPEVTLEADREPAEAAPRAPFWRSATLLIGLGTALITGVVALHLVAAAAAFTKTSASSGNTFVSGSVNLSVSPGSAIISMAGMMAGDGVTAPVTVTNTGTAALRYSVKSTTTENILASQLSFTIKSGVVSCDSANFGASGVVLYGPAALGSTSGVNLIGNPTTGAQAGDRPLAAATNEVLCFQVTLPMSTDSTYQNQTTTATFDFSAEQTVNNS
jgi:spore coat-associated protein N